MTNSLHPTISSIANGWLASAQRQDSPNFDARPVDCVPDLLVIHAISLPLGLFSNAMPAPSYVEQLFLNTIDTAAHSEFASLAGLTVSAHFFIRRDGSLVQFVSADERAWHAGVSQFAGRERCNDFSIGIELEGSDFVPFEQQQYDTLSSLTAALVSHYPIRNIVGHQDIAPNRKTDPGPFFDWFKYQLSLQNSFPLVLANAALRFRATS